MAKSKKNLLNFLKKRSSKRSLDSQEFQFNVEKLEERMMLNGDATLVFQADFEDANVERGNFGFVSEVSGLTASSFPVEIQNNHPSVGSASQGQKHLELDGNNGVFVDLDFGADAKLNLQFDYSARSGVSTEANRIDIIWNGDVISSVADSGTRLRRRTDFRTVDVDLEGTGTGRLEFRSRSFNDPPGAGGLLDNIRVFQEAAPLEPLELAAIDDIEVTVGASVNIDSMLLPPNANTPGAIYRLVEGPEGITINSATGEINWNATQTNIGASDARNDRTVIGDPETLFDAGFEDPAIERGGFGFTDSVSGFTAGQFPVELQNNHPSVGPASQGSQHLELDGTNSIFRDVATQAGDQYELIFDYSPRKGVSTESNAIEVMWDGQVIATVAESGSRLRSTRWQEYRLDVSQFTTDLTRLEFRSKTAGENPGLGGLLDNVRLVRRPVTVVDGPDGKYDVTVEVTAPDGRTDRESFKICIVNTVNQPPVLDSVPDQSVNENDTFEYQLVATDSDDSSSELRFAFTENPAGAQIDEVTGLITWSTNEDTGPGVYQFKVEVKDPQGLSDETTFEVTVNEVNTAPVLTDIPDQEVTEGQSITIQASATDADVPANSLIYEVTQGPEGILIGSASGQISWTPTEAQAGQSYEVTVQVSDGAGGFDTKTFMIEVIALPDRPPVLAEVEDQGVDEGDQLEVFLMASDPDSPSENLRFELVSGPQGVNVDANTGQLTWTPTEVQGPGEYTIEVRVTDDTDLFDTTSFGVVVREVSVDPVIAAIEDQTLADGESFSLAAMAIDVDVPENTLTWSIDAGPDGIDIDSTTGQILWTPSVEQTPGVYDVTVRVDDGNGGSDTESFQIRVNVENEAPILAAIEDQGVDENTTFSLFAMATDGDIPAQVLTYSLSTAPDGASIDSVTGEIAWTPDEAAGPRTYDFTVVVTDSENATDSESFQLVVNEVNLDPVLADIPNQIVEQENLLQFTVSATDADLPANTLTYGLTGTVPTGLTIDDVTGQISWTPSVEATLGDYDVMVTVSDGNGGSDMATVRITVTESTAGILLAEGEDFESTYRETLTITEDTRELVIEFAEVFDTFDADFINDAFEIALLDEDGNSLVHTIDSNRDAFFNLTEGESIATGVNTIVEDGRVRLDLSQIPIGTEAALVFRLVNNDADTQSQVRITNIETTTNQLDTPIGTSFATQQASLPVDVDLESLTDVTGSFQVNYGQTSFDAESSTLFANIELTNQANQPIDGPFVLVVRSITDPNVAVVGADGLTPDGDRYYLLDDLTGLGTVESNASTLSTVLEFFNPNTTQFGYSVSVLAHPNVAPNFVTTPISEGEVGVVYSYDADAIDNDGDNLTYTLMAGPDGLSVDAETGLINWTPDAEDLGTHSIIVEVADGRGGKDMQQYDIGVVEDRPNRPPVIVSTPVVETYLSSAEQDSTGNLVTNGSFEEGNVGFTSDYSPNGLGAARTYLITDNPRNGNGLATVYGDATTGTGNMMAVNGSTTFGDVVWEQTIEVTENTTYDFAANISSWFPAEPARLAFTVNGETIGELIAPAETGVWELIFATWESGDATEAVIQITNGNVAFGGNDFALDDIYFGAAQFSAQAYQYQVQATDPDLDPLTYSLDKGPDGMFLNSVTGLISWLPNADQIGTHTIAVTARDGRGGSATQEYEIRVFADPTNTAPVIVSDPVDDFFVPGFSNPASGPVSPQRIALDLGNGETFEGTVSIQLPGTAARFADIVLAVDESSSMGGSQDWIADMIPLLDQALIDAGIGSEAETPNRFAIVGGGRQNMVSHFLSQQPNTSYKLYGPDEILLAEGVIDEVLPDEILNLELPETGQYVLVIEPGDRAELADGIEIGLTANTGEPVRFEQLELNKLVQDEFLLPGQVIEYEFSIGSPTLIHFDTQVVDFYSAITWTLEGPDGVVANANSIDNPKAGAYAVAAGDYRLRFDSASDTVVDIKFAVLDLLAADEITSGETVSGKLDPKVETDTYRFTSEAGQMFQFVNSAIAHPGSKWRLIDAEGNTLLDEPLGTNVTNFEIVEAGEYYLTIEAANFPSEGAAQLRTPSTYEFTMELSAPAPPIDLTLGDVVNGEIEFIGDFVEYAFTLNERSLVYFDSLVDSTMTWTMTGPRGEESSLRFNATDSFNNVDPVYDLVAGEYVLRIEGNGLIGSFAFQVLNLAAASEVTPGTSFSDELAIPNQTNIYKFDAVGGASFFFDVETTSDEANTEFKLIDPFGQVVARSSGLRDLSAIELTNSGTYTLLVEGWRANEDTDTYTINIVPVLVNDVELSLGVETSGTIAKPGEIFEYSFTVAEDFTLVHFDSLTNRTDFRWNLQGPSGIIFENRTFATSDSSSTSNTSTPPVAFEMLQGDYVLFVVGLGDATGEFEFTLFDLSDDTQSTRIDDPVSGSPTTIDSTQTDSRQTQIYRFDAMAGDQFSFEVSTGDNANSVYRLVDPFGTQLFKRAINANQSSIEVPHTGTYFLLVEGAVSNEDVDEYSIVITNEGNNPPVGLSGNPYVLGTTQSGDITTDGQVDSYLFTLSESTILYLDTLINNSAFRVRLSGPAGIEIDNRSLFLSDSFDYNDANYPLLRAGTYQFDVYSSSTPGEYAFRLSAMKSAGMTITPGVAFSGDLTPPNETDIFNFDAQAGDQFYFDVESTSDERNTEYKLVDPNGNVVFISNGLRDRDVVEVAASGTYTLLIEGWRQNSDNDTYTMNVYKVVDTNTALTFGELVDAQITTPGQQAKFTFSVDQPWKQLYFDSLTNDSNVNWSLTGPRGTEINARRFHVSDTSNLTNSVFEVPAGDYTLTVDAVGDLTLPFQFRLLDIAASQIIAPGSIVEGMSATRATTAYKFDATAGDRIFIDFLEFEGFGSTPNYRLVDPFGVVVSRASASSDIGPLTLESTGSYAILVEGQVVDSGTEGQFSFEVVPLGNVNSLPTPTPLAFGDVISDEISVRHETDRYSFTLDEDKLAYFDSLTQDRSTTWSLIRNGRVVVDARAFDRSDSSGFTNPVLNLKSGEYILSVTSADVDPYSFRLLDFADATLVEVDTAFSGELAIPNSTDVYSFMVNDGDRVFFDVLDTSSTSAYYRVINSNGVIEFTQTTTIDQDVVEFAQGGVYYLIVEGRINQTSSQSYDLNLVDSSVASETLAIGETVEGTIGVQGDTVEYQFELEQDAIIAFDSLNRQSALTWSLSNSLGIPFVNSRPLANSDSTSFADPVINLSTGNYTLTIDAVGDSLGDYSFRLLDFASATSLEPGVAMDGQFAVARETDIYKFDTTIGQEILVDFENVDDSNVAGYSVYDPFGNRLFETSRLEDRSFEANATGTYVLLVEAKIANENPDSYTLGVFERTVRNAGPLALGATTSESIATPNDEVSYSFSLANDTFVHFDSRTNSADIRWTLEGPRGVEYEDRQFSRSDSNLTSNTSNPSVSFELRAGEYTLTVDGVDGSTGEFEFALFDLFDPTQSTQIANPVSGSPTTIAGTQVSPTESQIYRFDLLAGDQISFDSTTQGSIASDYRLIGPNGKQIFSSPLNRDVATVEGAFSGTYYLIVEGRLANVDNDEYSIVVTHEGNVPRTAFEGTPLDFATVTSGDLNAEDQVDSYTFTLGERSLMYLDALTNSSSIRWSLRGPRGEVVSNRAFAATDSFNFDDPVLDLVAGDYQLDVFASSGTPGAYSFSFYDVNASAVAVTPGVVIAGELTIPNETDFYSFDANAGDRFFIDVEGSDISNTEYKIVDPFGQTLLIQGGLRDVESFEVPRDGTYIFLIEGWRGNTGNDTYTFNLIPFVETRETLQPNRTTNASINSRGEELVYEFEIVEPQLLLFQPELSNSQISWSLTEVNGFEVAPLTYNRGQQVIELDSGIYELRIDGTDDFLGDVSFSSTLVDLATSELVTDGSIASTTINDDTPVHVYTFDGAQGQHFALRPDYNLAWDDSATSRLTAMDLVTSADGEDGYSNIDYAFRSGTFRDGAAVNVIMVSDEDRDVLNDDPQFESLFGEFSDLQALLNVVVSGRFLDEGNNQAIGVDGEGNAFVANGNGGFITNPVGSVSGSNISVQQEYIDLAFALDGAAWDLRQLRSGGLTAESFTNAFIDVKVEEILEQTALRLIPSNLDADIEFVNPEGGLFTDVVAGQTYDFEIKVGSNGRPISYDLLFTQGQTIGSIPVFIVSPYQYGATAVDADGDALTWSLVAGPEGIAIDAATGVLSWTADAVIYGEHEITIRVDDGRGGFDQQIFTLDVNGGEAGSIEGSVFELVESQTFDAGLLNGSFEIPEVPVGSFENFSGDELPGWTVATTGPHVSIIDGAYTEAGVTFQAQDGSQWLDLEGLATQARNGIQQDVDTVIGQEYTLSFHVGSAMAASFMPSTVELSIDNGDPIEFTNSTAPETMLDWQRFEYTFTATKSSTNIAFYNGSEPGNFLSGLDNVQLTSSLNVPTSTFTVFLDQNRNGIFDSGEQSTTSDEFGNYSFSSLGSGTYVVSILPEEGVRVTAPESRSYEVSIDPGEAIEDLDFVTRQVPLVNTDPKITSTPPARVVAGELFDYTPVVEELDRDTLTFDSPLAPAGLAVNPDNGVMRWTPAQDQIGVQNILLRVRDGNGGFDLQYFQVEVVEPNTAPTIVSTPPTGPAGVDLPYTYAVRAVDAQDDSISFSLSAAPEGMTIDAESGVISWTPVSSQIGVATVTVIALDERGLSSEQTFDLTVELAPANVDPVFLSEPPLEVRLGDNYLYRVSTFDQNGDPTTLTLDEAPDGMTLSPDGLIVWQPNPDQLGEQTVRLVVEDGRGGSAIQEFVIEVTTQPVNFPPEITSIPLTSAISGEEYRFQATAEDRNNDTLFWTLEEAPLGMAIDAQTGLITWQPDDSDLGINDVRVQVIDTYGAFSQLVYKLQVRATNTPPVILSAPPTTAAVGSTYLYQVGAEDIDQDRLTFSLLGAPEGMAIDANSGLVQWTPAAGQDGIASVEISVSDSLGATVAQTYNIEVADGQPNQLPVITSTPGFFTTVGATYTYQIVGEDPDGDELTYTLLSSQPGMTVNATTGLLEWTATADDLGTAIVEIVARDPALGGSIQQFSLTVLAANNAPVISSTPPTELASGQPFRYDVLATDADGEFLTYEIVSGPEGMLIDGLGRMFWIPGADQLGENDVEIRVLDPRGAFATQSFTVNVAADTAAPRVAINLSENPVDVGSIVDIRVQAIDNVGIESLVLTIDGVAVPLDANGNARVQLDTVGGLTALATATDAAGNSSTDEVTIFVADPNDVEGPVVSITSPGDGDSITAPTDIIGTVLDDTLVSYRLLLAEFGTRDFREIASGTENIDNGVLGQLDPTLLQNASYVLRLEAFDAGGNGNVIEQSVEIIGDLKLGNFQLAFTDLIIPVAGIPIEVTRVYDTLQADVEGDFGFGWRLEFRDTNLQVSLPETGLEEYGIFSAYQPGTRVYLNVPGEGRQGFTFDPIIRTLPGFGNSLVLATPRFIADPGVTSTLSVNRSGNLTVNEFGELSAGGGVPYNPASPDFGGGFTLTTENGIKYKINGLNGKLETAEDRNGNLLTFSESGISSTAGRSVVFNRDLSNRITSIEDPAGNTIEYAYSTSGDLVTVSDRLGQLTQFSYRSDRAHYLDQIIDPLDRPVSRSVYNDEGRLTRVIDVDGVPLEFEYDPDNFISIIEDTDGSTIVIEYDSRGNKRRVTDPSGGVVEYIYDENNFVTQQVDEFGETVSFSYDSSGRELSRTDQLGYIETFTRNAAGQLIASVDKLGNATTFERDTRGNIVAQTDALGNRTEFTVDQRGNVSQIVSPLGSTVQFEYDSFGDLVRQVDPAGVETAAEHDANGNQINAITSVLNPDNSITKVTTSFEYDANGRILAAVDPIGSKREFEYDALGNQIAEIDVNGERTSYEYDGKSRPTKVTYADGTSTETRYDENGNLQAAVGPNGQSTSMVYDASGRLISQVFPDSTPDNDQDNPQLDLDYIGRNRISTISDVSGTVNFVYDAVGNVIEREVEGESSVGFEFDALNRLVSYTDELGEVTGFEFDDVGNLIGITNPDGTTRSSTWDAHGNLISEVDELGNSTFYEYDQLDRLISITDALGQTTQYEYDSLGNLIKQTDAIGRATIYTYDLRGFLIATERPLGQTETRQYDAAGQLTSVIDFNGDETQFVYDSRNRVTQQIDVEGSIVNYSYNDSGSIVLVTDGRGETSYEYDERELLTRKVNPDGTELNYEYNQLGDLISISTPRWETSYTYDSQRQIESVSSGSGSTSYTYDAIGNLTVTALPNGTIETRSYTANGLLAAIVVEDANGSIIDSITYEFDNAGKRIGSVDADGRSVDYRYDAIGRLVFESISESGLTLKTIEYAYDAVGNRVSKLDSVEGLSTYQYNENDQLISEVLNGVTTVYTYDANGNQLSERTSASDSTVYSWDTDNRLVSVVTTSPTGTEIVEYEYDHQGNRVSRRINGELTLYLVDSNRELPRVVEELNSVGETERSYAWGNGLISQESNDQTFYYHRNHLGTVRKISSADGSIVNTYNYDAFGNLLDSNETIGNLFRFAGEPFDPITGLTYLRARHLQNSTGRFVSTDPFPGVVDRPFSLHRYQYADANPVSNTDPTGLVTLKEVLIASSIVTGLGALTTGYIAYKAGLDITWEGASAQFVFAPTILGGGIGGTVLTARNQGYETKAYHIQLFAGAVSPNIFSKVADNIGRIGFRSSAGFWREFSRFLFLTPAALPFDITFGTLQLKSPSAFANPYGIESSVLTGFWIQFGVGASGGLASLPALGPTFHANAVGIAGVIQGFGVGTFSVGTSLALAPNVGGSLLAGVSLPTPFGYDNRRIAD